MKLPVPSFIDRPVPYFALFLCILLFACFWPFNFSQLNLVDWEPGGGLRFTPPATAYTTVSPAKLATLRTWTIILDAKTIPPLKQARILSYAVGDRQYNFFVEQLFDDLLVRIRTGNDRRSRELHVARLFDPSHERRFQLAIVYNGQEVSLYLDGERKDSYRIGTISFDTWNASLPLVFGSKPDGTFPWRGILHSLSVFDRAVIPNTSNGIVPPVANNAVLYYSFDEMNGKVVVDQGSGTPSPLILPTDFIPCRRTILQSPRDYWPDPRQPFLRDIIANIIIYLPIGYLLSSSIAHTKPTFRNAVLTVLAGFAISLSIESVQAFLPTRYSSSVDLGMNTLGTGLGVLVQRTSWTETILRKLNITFRQSVR